MKIAVKNDAAHLAALFDAGGVTRRTLHCKSGATIFAQGAPANAVYCIVSGAVKLSVVSAGGQEAVMALLEATDFLGDCCLAGQKTYLSNARTLMATTLWRVTRTEMSRALHDKPDFSAAFLTYVLRSRIRSEAALIDQLFNTVEKRLARTLLVLADNAPDATSEGRIATVSQDMLAELVGTTRPRVNHFLNKFRTLGMIEYNGGLTVHKERLTRLLRQP